MESILVTIKKMLGIDEDYKHFDTDIIVNINTVFMNLQQLGIGPEEGFRITGVEQLWDDYLVDRKDIEAVKTYIYLKVKLLFDPPTNSFTIDSHDRQIKEIEWRLNVQSERGVEE